MQLKKVHNSIAYFVLQMFLLTHCAIAADSVDHAFPKNRDTLSPQLSMDESFLRQAFISPEVSLPGNSAVAFFNAIDSNALYVPKIGEVVTIVEKAGEEDVAALKKQIIKLRPSYVNHQIARLQAAALRGFPRSMPASLVKIINKAERSIREEFLEAEEAVEKINPADMAENAGEVRECVGKLLEELNRKIENNEERLREELITTGKAIEAVHAFWYQKWNYGVREGNSELITAADTFLTILPVLRDEIIRKVKRGVKADSILYETLEKSFKMRKDFAKTIDGLRETEPAEYQKQLKYLEAVNDTILVYEQILHAYEKSYIVTKEKIRQNDKLSAIELWKRRNVQDQEALIEAINSMLTDDEELNGIAEKFLIDLRSRLQEFFSSGGAEAKTAMDGGRTTMDVLCESEATFSKDLSDKRDKMSVAEMTGRLVTYVRDINVDMKVKGKPVVIVARDYSAWQLFRDMAKYNVCAVISRAGGAQSHWSLVAASEGIATVTGVNMGGNGEHFFNMVSTGMTAVVDAYLKQVVLNPTTAQKESYKLLSEQRASVLQYCEDKLKSNPNVATLDGKRIAMQANVNSMQEIEMLHAKYPGIGIGLIRLEFLLSGIKPKDLDGALTEIINKLLVLFGRVGNLRYDQKPDKTGKKSNLLQGLHYLLYDKIGQQLTALLFRETMRVAKEGKRASTLWPMVSSLDEIEGLRKNFEQTAADNGWLETPETLRKNLNIGAMIETVEAVSNIAEIVDNFDYFNIGTNDLSSDISGLGREADLSAISPEYLEKIQRKTEIEVFKAMGKIFAAVAQKNKNETVKKRVCICGEKAHDPLVIMFVAGAVNKYGNDLPVSLSMPIDHLAKSAEFVRNIRSAEYRNFFESVGMSDFAEQKAAAQETIARIENDIEKTIMRFNKPAAAVVPAAQPDIVKQVLPEPALAAMIGSAI